MDQNIILGIGLLIIILFFININNLAHFENFQSNTNKDINKTYFQSYNNYNKTIYEYITKKKIPNRTATYSNTNNTITDYYNKINKRVKELYISNNCGFRYKYFDDEVLNQGSMYLTESGIAFTVLDLNNNNGLISVIEDNITLVISDDIITHQIKKEEYNVDPIKGIITVFIKLTSFSDTFFSLGKEYILYPCLVKEHASNVDTPTSTFTDTPTSRLTSTPTSTSIPTIGLSSSTSSTNETSTTIDKYSVQSQQFISYNNIDRTIGFFICSLFILLLILNWKYIYTLISKYLNKKRSVTNDLDSEPKKVYIGGYDYKDYSE